MQENYIEYRQETLEEVERKQEEIQNTFEGIEQNLFMYVLVITVVLSMIFEGLLKYYKQKKNETKEKKQDYVSYVKKMRIILIAYAVYTIGYFIITYYILKLPIEAVIALIIASIFMVIVSTFVEIRIFGKKKKKGGKNDTTHRS